MEWNVDDFNDVESIWVKSGEIWTPDISIQNSSV